MAAVPFWQPKTFYAVDALVRARTVGAPTPVALLNPGFEDGDVNWTKGTANWVIVTVGHKYQGAYSAQFQGPSGSIAGSLYSTTKHPVIAGQSVTASCMVDQGASSAGNARAAVILRWWDAAALMRVDIGNFITSSQGGWQKSTLTIVAPPGALFVQIGTQAYRNSGSENLWVDSFTWNLTTPDPVGGLIYQNVAAEAGYSGGVEPDWPDAEGDPNVIDNECEWGARKGNRVVWEASPLMLTGATEPAWSSVPGNMVVDGDVSWKAETRHITDINCPHSKVVAIAASHVWAGDKDIVKFCAAANPLDWTTQFDAGYLPTGLQQQGADDVSCLNIYRSNLAVFNNATFQMWQIDPDPSVNALLDQLSGLGSSYQQAAAPVGDELYFLSALGVRTISVSVGSTNVASGDIGAPIDEVLRYKMTVAASTGIRPVATYFPGAGQYWIAFPE